MNPTVTALIPSKNRPDRVQRLVASIHRQDFDEFIEILVIDDGSSPALSFTDPAIRLIRNPSSLGACATRNRGFDAAHGDFIIMFDDDTELEDPTTIRRAVAIARAHPDFGAIGFRQINPDVTATMSQPANSTVACETSCFFGYGALLRRDAIVQSIRFVENFGYGYEEQDLCLQLHNAGWRVMYAPSLWILHHHDERGRNWVRIHRLIARNAIRSILLRFPLALVGPCAALRWMMFFRHSPRQIGRIDWTGGLILFFSTLGYLPYALTHRQPMAFSAVKRYRQVRNNPSQIRGTVEQLATINPNPNSLESECTLSASS